ncbi:uncharacterized protein At5g23160-like [Corylus avellana]|uniref:uncharacterized protein At5g23160-like n=1 Tax=Corylus avellana TaxID=13451 RepID=UPI001E2225C8|nr:uncharacterized protein At5g23160-like [Corylus avellana]
MKNVSRSKFLLCFRPVVDNMEAVLEPEGVGGGGGDRPAGIQGLPCISVVGNKEETKKMLTPKRNLSRVIKAVMFETLLSKRLRDRKQSLSVKPERSHDLFDEKSVNRASVDTNIDQEITTSSGLSHSSSFRSSSVNSTGSLPDTTKQDCSINPQVQAVVEKPKKVEMGCSGFNSGIHLLVISLIITILWGRLCAILFASICAYFVPRRHAGCGRQESVIKLEKTESREHKKKVIMEGFLERNHHRKH